jgi:hypothetical protein
MWMLDLQLGMARAWTDAVRTLWKAGADAVTAAARGVGAPSTPPLPWPAAMWQPFARSAYNPVQALTPMAFMFPESSPSPWAFSGLPGAWTWTPSSPWPAMAWSFASPWPSSLSQPANPLLEMSKLMLALPVAWASAMSSGAKSLPMFGAESGTRASATPAAPSSSYRSAGGHATAAVITTPLDVARSMSSFWSFEPMSGRKPH